MSIDLGELYSAARTRIAGLVAAMPNGADSRVCPATPEWTVHDVLAHLRGITEDVRTGNLEGATTDPWTRAQVERHRDTTMADLVAGWAGDAPLLESVLSSGVQGGVERAVFDIHAHECDLRGALSLAGELPDQFSVWALPLMAGGFVTQTEAAGLGSVAIETHEGDRIGAAAADTVLRVSRFELFRSVLGRRSAAQVLAYDWGGTDPTKLLRYFFVFGPRLDDLLE